MIFATVVNNEALKPANLERHLKIVHSNLTDRSPEFFTWKIIKLKKLIILTLKLKENDIREKWYSI